MRPGNTPTQFALPQLPTWVRNVMIGLFALFVTELILSNLGIALWNSWAWRPFDQGFSLHQLPLRYAVQGASRGGVSATLMGLVVLYFFLPTVSEQLSRSQLRDALVAAVLGGTALGLLFDGMGLIGGYGFGWTSLTIALVVLFGLSRPNGTILLFFVLPVPGWLLIWGTLIVELLMFLSDRAIDTTEALGVWLATYAWWHLLGPGSRRRTLKRKEADIKAELQRFQVIEGGRTGNRPKDDEWIH